MGWNYYFPNCNDEVWERISAFVVSFSAECMVTYPCQDKNQSVLVKGLQNGIPMRIMEYWRQIQPRLEIWIRYLFAQNQEMEISQLVKWLQ